TAKQAPAGQAPPRRPVCAPGTMSSPPNADRRRVAMFKSVRTAANGTRRRMPSKLLLAGAFVACAFGGLAVGIAWATPGSGITSTNLVGPVEMGEVHSVHQTPDWGAMIMTRGLSDVYVTHLKIVPGGHGGWHSHPGPSIIAVRSGTATFYDECDD